MSSSSNIPRVPRSPGVAMLLIAALLSSGASLQASPISGPINAVGFLVKGVVGIPFAIVGGVTQAVSKAVTGAGKKGAPKQ